MTSTVCGWERRIMAEIIRRYFQSWLNVDIETVKVIYN